MSRDNEVQVCNKNGILLCKNQNDNTFSLRFRAKNDNIIIQNVINTNLYDLMYELNKDVIERIQKTKAKCDCIVPCECVDVLFVFKRFGNELGVAQKYMFIRTGVETDERQIRFNSKSIPYTGTVPGCEVVSSEYANLIADIVSDNEVKIHYIFNMELDGDLPIYMENIAGMLMKKIFYRVKTFIENIK